MSEHFIVAEARRARERRDSMRHGQVGTDPDEMGVFLMLERAGLVDPEPEDEDPALD